MRTWVLAAFALVAVPVLVWADTAVAVWLGWRPHGATLQPLLAATLVPVSLVVVLVSRRSGRRWLSRRSGLVFSATTGVLGAVVAAELLARSPLLAHGGVAQHSRGPNVRKVFRPDPSLMPGVSGLARYTTNSLGIRGDEPTGNHRILAIGGSTTECTYLDDRETWPRLLAEELTRSTGEHVWAGNLGIAGYGTREHLDLVEDRFELQGIQTVIFLLGVNDLLRYLNGTDQGEPRPCWRRSRLASQLLWLRRHRRLERLLEEQVDETGRSLVARRRERARGLSASATLPDLEAGLRTYRRRLLGLAAACRSRQWQCLFVTQPVLWRAGLAAEQEALLWLGSDESGRFFPARELRRAMDAYNEALMAVCAARGLGCLDLAARMSGEAAYFYDDCHLTERGALRVAAILLPHSLESLGPDRSSGGRRSNPPATR